jgi:hypothetical protein
MLRQKGIGWLKRYLPAEIIGTITALMGAGTAQILHANLIVISYAGSIGESIGFYSTILIQSLVVHYRNQTHKNISFYLLSKLLSNIILEFGVAGLIDGLFIRPLFMYIFPLLLKSVMLGVFVGKIAGDVSFYFLVILSYEFINHHKNKKETKQNKKLT